MPIDREEVMATLRRHADHLREELAATERAIEKLSRVDEPCIPGLEAVGV